MTCRMSQPASRVRPSRRSPVAGRTVVLLVASVAVASRRRVARDYRHVRGPYVRAAGEAVAPRRRRTPSLPCWTRSKNFAKQTKIYISLCFYYPFVLFCLQSYLFGTGCAASDVIQSNFEFTSLILAVGCIL